MGLIQKIMQKLEKSLKLSNLYILYNFYLKIITANNDSLKYLKKYKKIYSYYKFNKIFFFTSSNNKNFFKRLKFYTATLKKKNLIKKRSIYFYLYFAKLYSFSFGLYLKKKKKLSKYARQYFVYNFFLKKKKNFLIPAFFSSSLKKFLNYMDKYQNLAKKNRRYQKKQFNRWYNKRRAQFFNSKKSLKLNKFFFFSFYFLLFFNFFKMIRRKKLIKKNFNYSLFYNKFLAFSETKLKYAFNFEKYFNCYLKKVYNNIFFTLTTISGDVLLSISSRNVKLRKKFKFKRKAVSIFFTVLPFFIYKIKTKFPNVQKIENLFFFNSFANFIKYKFLSSLFKQNISVSNIKNIRPIAHNSFKKLKKQKRR